MSRETVQFSGVHCLPKRAYSLPVLPEERRDALEIQYRGLGRGHWFEFEIEKSRDDLIARLKTRNAS